MPYVVVAYDIRDDARRLRVSKALKNALERVQKSVFEGWVDSVQLERVEARVRRHMDERQDNLRIYVLCGRCAQAVRVYGVPPNLEDSDLLIV